MKALEPTITVNVDVANPGQFFACCGLLALASRLWNEAEGWFDQNCSNFHIATGGTLAELTNAVATAEFAAVRTDDPYSSPIAIASPFTRVTIDWWETDMTGARDLKVWAGTMESVGIAVAMQNAMRAPEFSTPDLFNIGLVVRSPHDGKKKEPYYFDARRTPNAHSRDVGFSPNDLGITTVAHPAVELLCLIGLQFARPVPTPQPRVYDYFVWQVPLSQNLLLAASTGLLTLPGITGYRFENWFRTGQRKHKAFRYATSL